MITLLRRTGVAAAAAIVGLVATATPAAALPVPGPNQSVLISYYSNQAKTWQVGGLSYGSCGERFEWGTRTQYLTWRYINCSSAQ